jgi:hypothetical protein
MHRGVWGDKATKKSGRFGFIPAIVEVLPLPPIEDVVSDLEWCRSSAETFSRRTTNCCVKSIIGALDGVDFKCVCPTKSAAVPAPGDHFVPRKGDHCVLFQDIADGDYRVNILR